MKILFLVRDLAIGGSQRQLALLAAGLAKRAHDVAVSRRSQDCGASF